MNKQSVIQRICCSLVLGIVPCLLFPIFLIAESPDSLLTFLPREKYVPVFTADGSAHRISYNKLTDRGSLIGSMGGVFPVANLRYEKLDAQISLASSVYTHLNNAGIRFQVVNVDFFVDVYADIRLTPLLTLRIGGGHTSQHLSDDAFESLGFTRSINYARDYYQLFVVRQLPVVRGFVYGGMYYTHSFLIDTRIDGQWLFQAGGEFLNTHLYGPLHIYAAVDIKLRGELEYGSTQSYQAGLKISGDSYSAIRLSYTYRAGLEDRGQFYDQRISRHMIGMFFDF
jgi:hypothetical protein